VPASVCLGHSHWNPSRNVFVAKVIARKELSRVCLEFGSWKGPLRVLQALCNPYSGQSLARICKRSLSQVSSYLNLLASIYLQVTIRRLRLGRTLRTGKSSRPIKAISLAPVRQVSRRRTTLIFTKRYTYSSFGYKYSKTVVLALPFWRD